MVTGNRLDVVERVMESLYDVDEEYIYFFFDFIFTVKGQRW